MEQEVEKLRQQLREEQRRREAAEGRALEEQRRRGEAEGRALEEQRRRGEAEGRALEEQRRRGEAEGRALEEQRRREEAEELSKTSQPLTLGQYLEACHSLNQAIEVVTDSPLTTQGDTTKPTGRIFPRRIVPWVDFATKQEEIWDQLSLGQLFPSQPAFPSQHQLEYVKSLLQPISSEIGLRNFERDTVENAVQKLVDKAYSDPVLRSSLDLQGSVTFESHTNLGETTDDPISEPMEHIDINAGDGGSTASRSLSRKTRRKARGKGNLADQFCIYRASDGRNVAVLAIEYKAPHKLSVDEIVTGLESEIQPERDVINKDGEGFVFASRSLSAAVVTQLFSYMIGKGIQYGYVCTGEAFVFLHIPDDPTIVYYHVCVPNLDVMEDDEMRLHRTAVAQVFAFVLRALRMGPPSMSWHDAAAAGLDTWAVEYDDVLKNIPPTVRKNPRASPYKPQRWRGFQRSPIRTRSRCKQPDAGRGPRNNNNSDDEEEPTPPSPTLGRQTRSGKKAAASPPSGSGAVKKQGQTQGGGDRRQNSATQHKIQDSPFCTQQCLLGLAYSGPMDESCPNFDNHKKHVHIRRPEFLRLIRVQLAEDRGPDADCMPLYLSGSRGSLFKVRLTSHGYTLVAKGVERIDVGRLRHEKKVYDQSQAIQGTHIPVCLGMVDLVLPYYYDCGVFTHFLFLSWAGLPLFECLDQVSEADAIDAVTTALEKLHELGILHGDAEPRNITYDARAGSFMMVDLERAVFRSRRPPLGSISPNGQDRKRKRRPLGKQEEEDGFGRELRSLVQGVSRCISFKASR